MRYINLINQISDLDKERLTNYISLYGICKEDFMGLDAWLQNWSHSKQKLFKLLGNKLIHKVPFEYIKTKEAIKAELSALFNTNSFKEDFHEFYWEKIKNNKEMTPNDKLFFNHLMDLTAFLNDKIEYSIKYKKPDAQKTLQLQKGMKPMRALQKVMQYFDTEWDWDWDGYETFRLAVSRIFNDKKVEGYLCFSIHPLDFITMSDNDSNWQSCMNWIDEGCYRVGTIEMMNSNNVLCCYIEQGKNTNWDFGFGKHTAEDGSIDSYIWNNKKWRILTYVTKDIIMSGKSYPYKNDDYSKKIITEVRDLALKNLSWTYSFGPELYLDMKYVNSEYPLDRSRMHIQHHSAIKHNILWDTKGMYNDMLNDHNRNYWCFRNKVRQNKVISVSGKCPCLGCGGRIIEYDENEAWIYNERYRHAGDVICSSCMDKHYCESCGIQESTKNYHKIKYHSCRAHIIQTYYLCDQCYFNNIMVCPGCGKLLFIKNSDHDFIVDEKTVDLKLYAEISYARRISTEDNGIPIVMCYDCMKQHINDFVEKHLEVSGNSFRWFWEKRGRYVFFKGDKKFYYPYIKKDAKEVEKAVYSVINRLDVLNYLDEKLKNT